MEEAVDFIVVGSGSAGGVLAARLAEDGRYKVAVLEAGTRGPRYPFAVVPGAVAFVFDNPKVNWCRYSEPSEALGGRKIFVPAGKMLGGSSSINGMIFNRGQRGDYDGWAQAGCHGWSYRDILPYFKELESTDIGSDEFRGRNGPVRVTRAEKYSPFFDLFIEAAKAVGYPENPDYAGAEQYGISMAQNTIANGKRQSTATQFLIPASKRHNLQIIRGAEVAGLVLEGRRCVGVTYRQNGRLKTLRARREVTLSAGTAVSPKLLELSGIGNPEILSQFGISVEHALAGVGENLRDHFGTTLEWKFNRTDLSMADNGRGWRLAREVLRYALVRKGFISQGWAIMRIFGRSHEGVEDADMVLMANPYLVRSNGRRREMSPVHGFFVYAQVQRPESTGSIHIGSPDPFEAPSIKYGFLQTETDRHTAIAAVKKAREVAATQPLAGAIEAELLPGPDVRTDDEILDYARMTGATTYHPVGTCRMGNDAGSVVDSRLRVHGIDGLRIADCSIMPTIISGNTSVPAMMIGAKCADMMLADAHR